ncbi:MAG: YchF/TatD family DNA exonuclease [Deltaproteobacteria bacterium]|nr:YchF/TatD family DNA exonuclease [Deltaproteobacteria bacterium]
MLIDSHAHLTMDKFKEDRSEVLARAHAAGVDTILTVGTDPSEWEGVCALARMEGAVEIYAALGLHPHEASSWSEALAQSLRTRCAGERVVALGEIGFDFHYDHSSAAEQEAAFRAQVRLAKELSLPLVVHSREAEAETMRVLREEGVSGTGGVIHCFSGSREMARQALELGLFISFSGTLTFKNAGNLREIAREIPIEKMLIETDCPYLAPQPVRGKRNEPAYVRYVAEVLADLKGLTVEDVARITRHNARELFSMGSADTEGKIAYRIRDSLYLNITNRCTNACGFCVRNHSDFVKGHNLRLDREPGAADVIRSIGDPKEYREVVFCGYGEPLIRIGLVKEVAAWIHEQGGRVRINTNGQGDLIHGRKIVPELSGLVDAFSVSLNTENEEKYRAICRPRFGSGTYEAVRDFIRQAREIAEVSVTVLDLPDVDVEACMKIASEELQVGFRMRYYDEVG